MYFTQKYSTETTCFRVFPRVSSLLAKNLVGKNCCNFPRNHFFPLSPHLASIHLSSGSTACESDILFILFSLPLFLLKLSFRFLCWFTFSIVLSSNKTRREFEMESKEMIELRWICVLFSNVQPYRALPPAHHPGIIVLSEKNQQRNWKQSFATIHLSASLFPSGTKMVGEENISSFERKMLRRKTSQELRMLSSVTINCQITKIVMNSGSQLSEL